jgi:hypothetical protein
MACHATNRLYLHKLQKKTSYKLLTPKVYEGFLLGYDSNSHTYRVFNVTTDCVETTCDAVFDETNGFQKEQVDLDLVDDEEAPCDALQKMAIGDVWPQDPNDQPQEPTPDDTTPPTQGLDQDNNEEDESNDQAQEERNDQGGDEDDGDKRDAPPNPRVCHNVQRDHLVDNILGDIENGGNH